MRLDRLITLNLILPFRRGLSLIDWTSHRPKVRIACAPLPILMYHSISEDSEAGVPAYFKTCTSPAVFHQQMKWLYSRGYKAVTLSEGLMALKGEVLSDGPTSNLPGIVAEKRVVLTFDDGFRDFYTAARPILKEFGFSATMFLSTGFITPSAAHPRKCFKERECLAWDEVRELYEEGIEFGSHTVTHPILVNLSWNSVVTEIRDSRAAIANNWVRSQ